MSYMRDKDTMMRGIGAIAAIDANNPTRARARAIRDAAASRVDQRRAQLAHGPGRALPVPLCSGMGAVPSKLNLVNASSGFNNSVTYDPRTPRDMTTYDPNRPPSSPTQPVTVVVDPGTTSGNSMTTFPGQIPPKPPPSPVSPTKVPTGTATPPASSSGGGGGSGVIIGTPIVVDPVPAVPDMPEPVLQPSTGINKTTLAIGVGVGIGLLILISRRK